MAGDGAWLVVVADAREAGPKLRAALARGNGELLVTGVGKVAATLALTRRLATASQPWRIFIVGVAGAWRERGWPVGALVWVDSSWLSDEGVETPTGFRPLDDLGLGSIGPWRQQVAEQSWQAQARRLVPAPRGSAATVSTCSGCDKLAQARAERGQTDIETMESAALAQVCLAFAIPFVELRAISNYTGQRDRAKWDLPAAVAALDEAAATVIAGVLPTAT